MRKLIALTDRNKDGRIDVNEFHTMLYAKDVNAEDNAEQVIEEEDEFDSDEEESKE